MYRQWVVPDQADPGDAPRRQRPPCKINPSAALDRFVHFVDLTFEVGTEVVVIRHQPRRTLGRASRREVRSLDDRGAKAAQALSCSPGSTELACQAHPIVPERLTRRSFRLAVRAFRDDWPRARDQPGNALDHLVKRCSPPRRRFHLKGIARQVSHALARAILGVSGTDDHRATNALKNLLNVLSNVVGIAIYIGHGIVAWPETMAMMTGSLLGGFVGGRSMRFLPADLFRALVVGMGAILTVVFAWRYWNP